MRRSFFLFLIFIVIISLLVIRYKNIRVPSLSKSSTTTTTDITLELKEDEIVITYDQLEELIKTSGGSIISEVTAGKEEDHIKAAGKARIPFETDFIANITLKVEQDRIISEITYIKLGKIESPAGITGSINGFIQKGLDDKINGKYRIKSVKIGDKGIEVKLI